MAQKHLHELLKEDQEPFHLNDYIADRRSQLKRSPPKSHLQVKKRKPVHESLKFPGNLCHHACLFSFQETPDLRKSPLFEFTSPARSPCKSSNAIFLHVPARTAGILVEAALRIQKQSCSTKAKTQNKNHGYGLFGSLLKRFTPKARTQKRDIKGVGVKVSVKDILRWDSSVRGGRRKSVEDKVIFALEDRNASELHHSRSCNGRPSPSSAVWSQSNEEKSLTLETSTSTSRSEETVFVSKHRQDTGCASYDIGFCESPFRFVLQCSPSPRSRTPELRSPAVSPIRHKTVDEDDSGIESLQKFQTETEEEEKEQFSPVSVLDPPFEDDDDGRENDDEDDKEFDMECSYAIVQRAKQQLLHKLRRFEKLAQLDPVELEKRILDDQEQEDDEAILADKDGDEGSEDSDREASEEELLFKGFGTGVPCSPGFQSMQGILPSHMKRLMSDLISEEEKDSDALSNKEILIKRVSKKLEFWKEKESDTIDMMVGQDLRANHDSWRKIVEQRSEVARDVELSIFSLLVDELSEELV